MTEREAVDLIDATTILSVALNTCGATVEECRAFSASVIRAMPKRISTHAEVRRIILTRFSDIMRGISDELAVELRDSEKKH